MWLRFTTSFLILLLAASVSAKNPVNEIKIQAVTVEDGVMIKAVENNQAFSLNLSGPAGLNFSKSYRQAETAFIDINDVDGQPLADGLYKYEIKALPAIRISREESSTMPDRNDLKRKSSTKASPVNGSFRVVNGWVVDDQIEEFGNVATWEHQE